MIEAAPRFKYGECAEVVGNEFYNGVRGRVIEEHGGVGQTRYYMLEFDGTRKQHFLDAMLKPVAAVNEMDLTEALKIAAT